MKTAYFKSFFVLFFLMAIPVMAGEGRVSKGVYTAPTGHFTVKYPLKKSNYFKFQKSSEKEAVIFSEKNYFANDGLWMAGFLFNPNLKLTLEQFKKGAQKELTNIPGHYGLDNSTLRSSKEFTVNGRPAVQYNYTGMNTIHPAVLISTLILNEDSSITFVDLLFKALNRESSHFLERYESFLQSFQKR